ncbi:MAG: hypothetical protein AAGA90_18460 [Actinomycetota bacterium]
MANDSAETSITFDTYDRAYRAFLRCMIDTGVGFFDLGFDPWLGCYRYGTEGDSDFEARTGRTRSDECYDRHFAVVDQRWQSQVERDHLDRRWELAAAFVRERGVEIPPWILEHRDLDSLRRHAATTIDEATLTSFGLAALDLR